MFFAKHFDSGRSSAFYVPYGTSCTCIMRHEVFSIPDDIGPRQYFPRLFEIQSTVYKTLRYSVSVLCPDTQCSSSIALDICEKRHDSLA
ncbi:unnamed protein product [Lasius platythorax]|uniref:Uncharacterized protein n=1 Tax=Lasius platythorax TaxID=488582 RepID=A0AAV2P4E1_9HYME